ncbi:MAG: hypothetical protein QNK37_02120 [Acidobacteriota bacterium]|nr:hypothetical protein [Acidobacteriota bacterium]
MKKQLFSKVIAVTAACLLILPGFAGGSLDICQSGVPFVWPANGTAITYNVDMGGLATLNSADATQFVDDAFQRWADIPSCAASYKKGPALAQDIDETNVIALLNTPTPDGISPIVLDEDGDIFNLLFGFGSGVLGFAGPEWVNPSACEIIEGLAFINGGAVDAFFPLEELFGVVVHELGHFSGLAHVVVNAEVALFGDSTGPSPNNTVPPENLFERLATMYPFAVVGGGQATPAADDIAYLTSLYPEPGALDNVGRISGTIFGPDGTTRINGVNIIARNLADPFDDAVSVISGYLSTSSSQADPNSGRYTLNGLTPGADYIVFVDELLAGAFSTPALSPLPGAEELYNGANESSDPTTDDPAAFTTITAVAGTTIPDIDIIFNTLAPGPVPLGDDDFVELTLPFDFQLCGETYTSVFLNSNGNLTFGAPSTDFSESKADMLGGPPRIAGLWTDLNPTGGGVVSFDIPSSKEFVVRFDGVPSFPATGSNTFEIKLEKKGRVTLTYDGVTEAFAVVGTSCGSDNTTGFETEDDFSNSLWLSFWKVAFYEEFAAADFDLDNTSRRFNVPKKAFKDRFEPNNTLADAAHIRPDFSSNSSRFHLTRIDGESDDVDFFEFDLKANQFIAIEVVGGNLDSFIGLFDRNTGDLLITDDDGGGGLKSRLLLQANEDLELALAVTTFPDFDFTGDGGSSGRYLLTVNKYDGEVLPQGDDTTFELPLGFDFHFNGQDYSSVFVNSNGNLTFGASDTSFFSSVSLLLNGPPRVAPLWVDLNPSTGLVIAEDTFFGKKINFVSTPNFFSTQPNYFSVELQKWGGISFDYEAISSFSSIVGVTEGGGAVDPGPSDFSSWWTFPSAQGTSYEQFSSSTNMFDLGFFGVWFWP